MKFNKLIKSLMAVGILIVGISGCDSKTYINSKATIDKAQIEEIVKNYLIQNPEILVQSLQNLQQKQIDQARKSIQKTQEIAPKFYTELFLQKNDPSIGNPQGKVTLVEFFDYQCPHCVAMVPVLDELIKSNPDLRIVFKEFPIRGSNSDFAARAALAAHSKGKYYQFHKGLMEQVQGGQKLTREMVLKVFKNIGLNPDTLKTDTTNGSIDGQVKANTKLGQSLELIGTPAFFISKSDGNNTTRVEFLPGQIEETQLQDAINKAKS